MKYWHGATYKINNSNQKLKYTFGLTPKGIQQKIILTKKFIVKKIQEHDKLRHNIYY